MTAMLSRLKHFTSSSLLRRNIRMTLGRQLLAAFAQFLLVVLIARELGPEGNGFYAMAILIPTLLANFLNLGVGPATVYYVSRGEFNVYQAMAGNVRLALIVATAGVVCTFPVLLIWGGEDIPWCARRGALPRLGQFSSYIIARVPEHNSPGFGRLQGLQPDGTLATIRKSGWCGNRPLPAAIWHSGGHSGLHFGSIRWFTCCGRDARPKKVHGGTDRANYTAVWLCPQNPRLRLESTPLQYPCICELPGRHLFGEFFPHTGFYRYLRNRRSDSGKTLDALSGCQHRTATQTIRYASEP